jgi:hypothetical protein
MARSAAKRSRVGESGFKWTSEEWTYLLAYIDLYWSQDDSRRRPSFENALKPRMRTKFSREFSDERIDKKIIWIASQRSSKATTPEDIRCHGSNSVDFGKFWPREMEDFELARKEFQLPSVRKDSEPDDEIPPMEGEAIANSSAAPEESEGPSRLSKIKSTNSTVQVIIANMKGDDPMDRSISNTLEPEERIEPPRRKRRLHGKDASVSCLPKSIP